MSHTAYPPQPTRTRYRVLAMLVALASLTYMDRLCISAAAPDISKEFGLSPSQMGYVFSAFTLAYAMFEIPSGWYGDYYGTRRALTRIVLWWSAFTIFTGATAGFASLLIVRFLFGMGEAGALPNSAGTVSRWFPISQQGRAMGAVCIGHAIGAAATPPLVFYLISVQGWRWTFFQFGVLGAFWCVLWFWWFRDKPEEHSTVNEAEIKIIRAGQTEGQTHSHSSGLSWRAFLYNRNLLFLCAMYFAYGYSLYFYITWLPTYLLKARNFSTVSAGYFSALPWLFGAVAFLIGGFATDTLARRTGNLRIARCGMGVFGLTVSGVVMATIPLIENNVAAALLIACALFFQFLTTPSCWASCLDIGRSNAGVVTGALNTTGNLAGTLAPIVFGYILEKWGSWTIPFYVAAAFLFVGVVMWLFVDPRRPISEPMSSARPAEAVIEA